jgi:hypothetical protein
VRGGAANFREQQDSEGSVITLGGEEMEVVIGRLTEISSLQEHEAIQAKREWVRFL